MIVNTFEDKALNSIPKNWKLDRIKNIANIYGRIGYRGYTVADIVSEGDGALSISPGNIFKDIFTLKSKTFISWDKYYESPEIKIFENDIILVKTGSTIGKVALVPTTEYKLTLNPQVVVLKKIKIDNSFLYYVLTSDLIKYYFECFQSGGATPAISQEKINNFKIFYPSSVTEQQAIANYLDAKTQAIDKKISLLEQKIETYKKLKRTLINQTITKGLDKNVPLKDSGISWVGQIPQHWEVKRLKDLGTAIIGLTYSPENLVSENEGILVLRSSNIQNNKLSLLDNVYVDIKPNEKLITKKGDILLCSRNGSRALIGKNIIIDDLSSNLTFGAFMTLYRSKYNKFISYFFNSKLFDFQSGVFMTSTINQLTINVLNNLILPLPQKSEQEAIANYLDHKTATIDDIIGNISKQIETLKQLRKTLINDVVTGKIKVIE